ncbi:hypothetical protein GCM10027046_31850 [Uliginosibacterium flavum]|uniref:Lipoprotein n=1 Tax=Uliginosibacterium flavum TaxID=1396831 RepID=A0ABV2TQD3_9RHOO
MTRALLRLLPLALLLLSACGSSPAQQRANDGHALFEDRCKNVAGIKIYKTVEDVEGIVLLKVRPKAGEREWADPMWPGAAFALEREQEGYITSFLAYEHSSSDKPVTPLTRGYITTDYQPNNPSNLPGYRYVDLMDAATGKRERYSLAQKPRPTSKIGWIDTVLEHRLAQADGPQYGVTFEDHVIPEERVLGLASSTVKVLDLQTNEVLGEMKRYAWTPAKPNSASPSPWLAAYKCPGNPVGADTATRTFVDQVLKPHQVQP